MFQSLRVKKGKFSHDWPSKRVFFRIVALRRCVPSAAALDGKIPGRQNAVMGAKTLVILPGAQFLPDFSVAALQTSAKTPPILPKCLVLSHFSAKTLRMGA